MISSWTLPHALCLMSLNSAFVPRFNLCSDCCNVVSLTPSPFPILPHHRYHQKSDIVRGPSSPSGLEGGERFPLCRSCSSPETVLLSFEARFSMVVGKFFAVGLRPPTFALVLDRDSVLLLLLLFLLLLLPPFKTDANVSVLLCNDTANCSQAARAFTS